MKIVINSDYGGFNLSDMAVELYAEIKGISLRKEETKYGGSIFYIGEEGEDYFDEINLERNDSILVEVVSKLGNLANGFCASLSIVEIPDDVEWQIEEYDGNEWVAEKHRTWR